MRRMIASVIENAAALAELLTSEMAQTTDQRHKIEIKKTRDGTSTAKEGSILNTPE